MKDFFLFETELSPESGFRLFGFCHIAWLVVIVFFTWLTGKWYANQTESVRKKAKRIMGIIFPVISIYRDCILVITGNFNEGFFPLHLCGMALWIAVLYIWTGKRFWGVIYVLLCVPGAVGALLFPDWVVYPFFNYMHIHDFISHGLITAFGFWLIRSKEVIPEWKEFWMPVVFGIAGFIILPWVNAKLETNYWFLTSPSVGSPLIWIERVTGEKWYLAGYFLTCVLVVALWQKVLSSLSRIF